MRGQAFKMPGSKALGALRWLTCRRNGSAGNPFESSTRFLARQSTRSMATVTQAPTSPPTATADTATGDAIPRATWKNRKAITTVYDFETMEPLRFKSFKNDALLLPLRRDLLHRAVIYEGDRTRQGTASAKWRLDVRGTSKRIRPQKGSGRARLGDKKSPMLRGGGVAHGPHPRDFATGLQKQVYDKAFRTALSYRYRRGQLIIVDDTMNVPKDAPRDYIKKIISENKWGKKYGRSLFITRVSNFPLNMAFRAVRGEARVLSREHVDVKDLLTSGRVIIEQSALHDMLLDHK